MKLLKHFFLLILIVSVLIGCSSKDAGTIKSVDDALHAKIAVMVGTTGEQIALKRFPEAEIMSFDNRYDVVTALATDKVDAAILSEPEAELIAKQNPIYTILSTKLNYEDAAIAVSKGREDLLNELNRIIIDLKNESFFEESSSKWFSSLDSDTPVPEYEYENSEALVIGVCGSSEPFCFLNEEQNFVGFEIDFAHQIGAKLKRPIVFQDMFFSSLLAALKSNKIDMIIANMTPTEERKKAVNFSIPYFQQSQVMMVKNRKSNLSQMSELKDINNKKVGVYAGTIFDTYLQENFDNVQVGIFNTSADILTALKTKKIDAAMLDLFSASVILKKNPDIGLLTDDVFSKPLGYGFNKNNQLLLKRFNSFLKEIKQDGTYDKIYNRWCVNDPEDAELPPFTPQNSAERVFVGIAIADLPYAAIKNGEYVGFDIEMLRTFGQRENISIEIKTMEFSALISALAAGKVDIIADGIAITDERQKRVNFSDSYLDFQTAIIALKENLINSEPVTKNQRRPFLTGLIESFYNNIILENRYLLIWKGLKTTVIISILSAILGTILGAFTCFLRMSKVAFLRFLAKLYITILRGTPVLVLLMIIFYIIFASVNINPILVATIAFGLNFGAYVSEMFRTGIEGVKKGQTEAGIALGFSRIQTFLLIVLPQAVKTILPVYKGELISMVKMTSVVGYIAVQDLTKASDLIRSRTFDAFFPLIMITILYFIISWGLLLSLGHLEKISDPKSRRNKISSSRQT